MKKVLSIVLICCLCLSLCCINIYADEKVVSVFVDGDKLVFDVDPVVEDGRTLVPIRAISEYLKYEVNWDNEKWEAEIKNDGNTMVIGVDKTEYTKNGEVKEMDVPAKLVNGRTLVPLRLIAENFGCTVDWDGDKYAAYIYTQNQNVSNNLEKVSELFDVYPIPDYNDYSPGSINNPLASDTRYGERGDYFYSLVYQPSGEETQFVQVTPIVTLVGESAKHYISASINDKAALCTENQRWKVYIVSVTNLPITVEGSEGAGININRFFAREHICTKYAEKYTIHNYYVTKALSINHGGEKGKLYTDDNPYIQDKGYVNTFGICVLSDANAKSPLFKVVYDDGSKATWLHLDSSKTKNKLEVKSSTTIPSEELYDLEDLNEVARYNVDMKLRQLAAKREDIMKEYRGYLDYISQKSKGTTLSYSDSEVEKSYTDRLKEVDEEIEYVKTILEQ